MKKRKEMFFDIGAPDISLREWKKLGEPIMWFKMYEKDDITIWDDRALGGIRLKVGEKISESYDIVSVGNVAAFGISYSDVLRPHVPYVMKE